MSQRPRFSPDGRWIAYQSDESGQLEVYIRPYPRSEGKWQVSTERRRRKARWNPNGKEIFYAPGDAMMAVDVVETEAGITLGQPGKTLRTAFVDSWQLGCSAGRRTLRHDLRRASRVRRRRDCVSS